MQLYDDPTTVATPPALPAAGTPGYLTDGAPGLQARTIIRAWIINGLISEVVNTIEGAGLTPDRTNNAQLLQAIKALIAPLAPIQSPAFTGEPTAPTCGAGDDSTNLATTAFVATAIAALAGAKAGGDLTGNYPNPTLAQLGSAQAPNLLTALTYDTKGRVTGYRTLTKVVLTSGASWTPPAGVTQVYVEVIGGGGGGAGAGSAKSGGGGGAGGYSAGVVGVTPGQAIAYAIGAGGGGGAMGGDGAAGGTTSFGSLSATGGGQGLYNASTAGGGPGNGSGGAITTYGGSGTDGSPTGVTFAGNGGASFMGGGGRGGSGGGINGAAFGSGGGGAYNGSGSGGAGAAGVIILTY